MGGWIMVVGATAVLAAVLLVVIDRRALRRARKRERQATSELERSRARWVAVETDRTVRDTILGRMQEGVLLLAPDASVRYSNTAAGRHLPSIPVSRTALLPLGLREAADRAADGEATTVEVQVGTPSRWIRATALPVEPTGSVLLVLADVTESRRIDSVRRDFVANASHELKTPAASIQAMAETIRTALADDAASVPRFADQLERETSRLSRIVADLLDLSRLESGSELLDLVRMDGVLREERERAEDSAARAGVEFEIDVLSPIPPVRGAARDLSLLVRNLLDNAIRYTKPGGRVRAGVSCEGSSVVLSVSDTGVGIPSRDLDRIFERFYRVDRARSRETGGTGLGLSIVKHVIENHGGSIEVRSELGRGTTFEVRLPAAVT